MQFAVVDHGSTIPRRPGAYLVKDAWNDFGYVTTFNLKVRLHDGRMVGIGFVKIGHAGMSFPDVRHTVDLLPDQFFSLNQNFFSLGSEDDFYECLRDRLPSGVGHEILIALNDVAYVQDVFAQAKDLHVFVTSLMRDRTPGSLDRSNLIATGIRPRIVPFSWSYAPQKEGLLEPQVFDFRAVPKSLPPPICTP